MLTRLFLAAGVAALAIAAPAYAGPGGGHGGGEQHGPCGGGGPHGGGGGGPHGGGGGGGPHGGGGPAFAGGGGGGPHGGGGGPHGGGGAPAFMGMRGGGGGHGGGPRFAAPQVRAPQMRGFARQQARTGYGRQQTRMAQRQQGRGFARQQMRMAERQHGHGFARQQSRMAERQQSRGFARHQARMAERQQMRGNRMQMRQQQAFAGAQRFGGRNATRGGAGALANQLLANQQLRGNTAQFAGRQFANGQYAKGQYPTGQYANSNVTPYSDLTYGNNVQVLPFQQADRFIGAPLTQVAQFAALSPLPVEMQYLYPATPDYYYQWGNGYVYQIDRTTNLIDALIPLLAGGYLPGQYVPVSYMADYVPDYYGLSDFYPDYGGLCNRYSDGVIYQVDCDDGYVEDVVPVYAGGYGVGQILPTAYSYYNVPLQYRGLYYDTPQADYWYAPGAIYQYDPRTSVITSVAALMSPGFTVGQPLPVGYDVYNVPYAYRATYYDTPNAWYRYNDGYIYQVDPVTQVVTAIVASLLT
jgi:hypothetical protein